VIENLSLARRSENKSLKNIYSCGSEDAARAARECYKTLDFSGDYCSSCFSDDNEDSARAIFSEDEGALRRRVCESSLQRRSRV
jgi:hypothetical protein